VIEEERSFNNLSDMSQTQKVEGESQIKNWRPGKKICNKKCNWLLNLLLSERILVSAIVVFLIRCIGALLLLHCLVVPVIEVMKIAVPVIEIIEIITLTSCFP
jgi:hypothetical protein